MVDGVEGRVVIERQPSAQANGGKFAAATASSKATAEQIKQRRLQIHTQAKAEATGASLPEDKPEAEPPPVREDLETIEFTAPNGVTIEYGPRNDISLVDRIARLFANRDPTQSEYRLTRILMGVRVIDGKAAPVILDEVTRTKIANQIGDEAIDLLMYYDRIHWPPLQVSELPVVKKKLRA